MPEHLRKWCDPRTQLRKYGSFVVCDSDRFLLLVKETEFDPFSLFLASLDSETTSRDRDNENDKSNSKDKDKQEEKKKNNVFARVAFGVEGLDVEYKLEPLELYPVQEPNYSLSCS